MAKKAKAVSLRATATDAAELLDAVRESVSGGGNLNRNSVVYRGKKLPTAARDAVERVTEAIRADDERRAKWDALLAAATAALEHLNELREAWRSGALDEHDGRGGERSNRNVRVCVDLRQAVEAVREGRS